MPKINIKPSQKNPDFTDSDRLAVFLLEEPWSKEMLKVSGDLARKFTECAEQHTYLQVANALVNMAVEVLAGWDAIEQSRSHVDIFMARYEELRNIAGGAKDG